MDKDVSPRRGAKTFGMGFVLRVGVGNSQREMIFAIGVFAIDIIKPFWGFSISDLELMPLGLKTQTNPIAADNFFSVEQIQTPG